MDPKSIQSREQSVQLPKMAQDGAHEWFPSMMVTPLDTFLGPPLEPKNHQNSTFCGNGCAKERVFMDFCSQYWFSPCFKQFFGRCFMKHRWKIRRIFSQPHAFFSSWRPSRNIVFYISNASLFFDVFLSFVFFTGQMVKK